MDRSLVDSPDPNEGLWWKRFGLDVNCEVLAVVSSAAAARKEVEKLAFWVKLKRKLSATSWRGNAVGRIGAITCPFLGREGVRVAHEPSKGGDM